MSVIDASVVVAALVDGGPTGTWAVQQLVNSRRLIAPHLLPSEVANVLRRAERSTEITAEIAAEAFSDLSNLAVDYFPFSPFHQRIWELRHNVSIYDAWYVALAEAAGLPLLTLDRGLARAPGTRCAFETPPA